MSEFDDLVTGGYDIPDNAPDEVQNQAAEFYKHVKGRREGICGRIEFKFKNANNDKCEAVDPGARCTGYNLKIYILKENGEQILSPDLSIPNGLDNIFRAYYSLYMSANPKDQWQIVSKFNEWILPNHKETAIVDVKPGDAQQSVYPKRFKYFYGLPVIFNIAIGKQKGNPYVDNIELGDVSKRVPIEIMQRLEKDIQAAIDANKKSKNAEPEVQREAPPETNIDDLVAGSNEDNNFFDPNQTDNGDLPF